MSTSYKRKITGRGNSIKEKKDFADDRWKNDCRTQPPQPEKTLQNHLAFDLPTVW